MRIISQDGSMDVPYKNKCVSVNQDNCIVVTEKMAESLDYLRECVFAKYSSKEKAKKAMQMLHEDYHGYIINITMGIAGYNSIKNIASLGTLKEMYKPYFQFPKDEDVEV